MLNLIKTDVWILKWKFVYLLIFNFLSCFLFWKKFIFLTFFFYDFEISILLNQSQLFDFLVLYNLSDFLKYWIFFSIIFYYFFNFNFLFFLIIFKTSLYKVENKWIFIFFFKFNILFWSLQILFFKLSKWYIYLLQENFIENFFKIENNNLFNFEKQLVFFLLIFFFLLFIYFFILDSYYIKNKWKLFCINIIFLWIFLFNLIYIDNYIYWIIELFFLYFLRYIYFFFNNI